MASFRVEVAHALGAARGRAALEGLIQQMMARFGQALGRSDQHWDGNCLTFQLEARGFEVSGRAEVGESSVVVAGDCPWLARGVLESNLREELGHCLRG